MRFIIFSLLAVGTVLGQPIAEPRPLENAVLSLSARAESPLPDSAGTLTGSAAVLPSGAVPNATPLVVAQPSLKPIRPSTASWKLSLLVLAAANAADAATSWNKRELNPVLASSGQTFGVQTLAVKLAFVGVSVGIQGLFLHYHPEFAKKFARLNLVQAGIFGAVAVHNATVSAH